MLLNTLSPSPRQIAMPPPLPTTVLWTIRFRPPPSGQATMIPDWWTCPKTRFWLTVAPLIDGYRCSP